MHRLIQFCRRTVSVPAALAFVLLAPETTIGAGEEQRDYVWDITFPVEKGYGNYQQGWHDCRDDGCSRAHRAVDIYASPGTPVYAAADGTITWLRTSAPGSGWSSILGSGYALYIDHPNGKIRHFYGHFGPEEPGREEEAFAVNPNTGELWQTGDTVQRGDHLGYIGTSGATASGPHVHFELRSLREGYPADDPGDDAIDGRSYGDPDATIGSFTYLRYDPFHSLQAAEARDDYSSGASPLPAHFTAGDYVKVDGVRNALRVRGPDACDSPIDEMPNGTVGRIIDGPARCPEITNYDMWKIQWSDCTVGWSSEYFLEHTGIPDDFCPEAEHEVSVDIEGEGEVVVAPAKDTYPAGTTVTIEALPGEEFTFTGWSGTLSDAENPVELSIEGDVHLTAHFHRTYTAWEESQFSSAEREEEGRTDPESDPFGHRVSNLLAYAFGLDVRNPDRSALPNVVKEEGESAFLFRRRTDTSDLTYRVEISADLSGWMEWAPVAHEGSVLDSPEQGIEIVRLPLDPENAARFFRLRVELAP